MIHPLTTRAGPSCVLLITMVAGCVATSQTRDRPRVAGQPVPREAAVTIDFEKRFDLHTRLDDKALDFQNCKIVGFVEGEGADAFGGGISSSKFVSFSRGWLVIEKPDRRRVYIPAGSLIYFEDAAP